MYISTSIYRYYIISVYTYKNLNLYVHTDIDIVFFYNQACSPTHSGVKTYLNFLHFSYTACTNAA